LQQVGSPQELYDRPDNLFVAGFIGSPAMNFLPAALGRFGWWRTAPGLGRAAIAADREQDPVPGERREHER
jgi:multiple sugar transport system ATP-binding protein